MMNQPGRFARKAFLPAAVVIVIAYVGLAAANAYTQRPWCDEGWFANPAYNLITHGTMGTTVLEPSGHSRHPWGIREHTYWITPLHILAQAAWYQVTGFSLASMRWLSIFWGLAGLAAWFQIVRVLTGRNGPALAAAGLVCCDFTYVTTASVGRMDMMSAALGWAALAVYLTLRERRFTAAVLSSHTLVAASGLTHPVGGVLAFAALVFLTLRMDRKRLRAAHISAAMVPYAAGGVGWGLYILQAPGTFLTQFSGNATGRFSEFFSPLAAIRDEVVRRYLAYYGFRQSDSLSAHWKALVPATYFATFAAGLVSRRMRTGGTGTLLGVAGIYVAGLAIFDSTRQSYYLIYPVAAMAVISVAVWHEYAGSLGRYRFAAIAAACAVVLINLGTLGYRTLRLDTMHNGFVPAVSFLQKTAPAGSTIMGSGEFGFGLGFDGGLEDDPTLGYYTGKKPDFIVVDPLTYQESFNEFRRKEPAVYAYVNTLLDKDFTRTYNRGSYEVYARRH